MAAPAIGSMGPPTLLAMRRIGPPGTRQGFERLMFPGVQVGLLGWERAHSQGAGTGTESALGILYAPSIVNQELQNRGIEDFIRTLQAQKRDDVDLFLTTATRAWVGTRRLASIEYRVDARRGGRMTTLLEASIEVANQRHVPRVVVEATKRAEWEDFLKAPNPPSRRTGR